LFAFVCWAAILAFWSGTNLSVRLCYTNFGICVATSSHANFVEIQSFTPRGTVSGSRTFLAHSIFNEGVYALSGFCVTRVSGTRNCIITRNSCTSASRGVVFVIEAFSGFASVLWCAFEANWVRMFAFALVELINNDARFLGFVALCGLTLFVELGLNCPLDAIMINFALLETCKAFNEFVFANSSVNVARISCADRSIIARNCWAVAYNVSIVVLGARSSNSITCISWSTALFALFASDTGLA
jgi:hypothetical protein